MQPFSANGLFTGLEQERPRLTGTHVSTRLRAGLAEEWQQVPREWLADDKSVNRTSSHSTLLTKCQKQLKMRLETGGESSSELMELSSEDIDEVDAKSLTPLNENEPLSGHTESCGPPDFVEWET